MSDYQFPLSLRPIIQQGFLDREFEQALRSRSVYRACADRIDVTGQIGEQTTGFRDGLREGSVETWTATINLYAATVDLNLVTDRVGIASQFLQNAYANGEQAARSLDELARNALYAAYGTDPLRPRGAECAAALNGTDVLKMSTLMDAVAKLRKNNAPDINGAYNCYLEPMSAWQLFTDPDFRSFFQGATSANQVFKKGMTNDFLGLRFIPTTEAFVQAHPTLSGLMIRRPVICGQGALIEDDYAGMLADDVVPADAVVTMVDGVAMVTRHAVDRLQQIIAQSWYWIGGFSAPADTVSGVQRAVVIEHIG